MLTDLGYGVVQATSGTRALALLKSGLECDLILSDYLMPGMSGGALFRELRQAAIRKPMLLLTGYANVADDVPGDLPRLAKPFRQAELAARVEALLASQAGEARSGRSLRVVD
jgi:CheY-like chemotaxis protein